MKWVVAALSFYVVNSYSLVDSMHMRIERSELSHGNYFTDVSGKGHKEGVAGIGKIHDVGHRTMELEHEIPMEYDRYDDLKRWKIQQK